MELQKIFQSTKTHTTQELNSEVIVPQDDGVIFLSDLFQKCATIEEGVVALRDYKDNPYKFQYLPVSSVSKLGEEGEKMYLEQCKKVQYDIFKLQMQLGKFRRRGELIIENTSSAKIGHSYIFRHDEKDRFSNEGGDLNSAHQYKKSTKRLKAGIVKTVASNHKVSLAGDLSKQNCAACGYKQPLKLATAAEAAFYRKFHIPKSVSDAYRWLMRGVYGSDAFQPAYKVEQHNKTLQNMNVDYEVGLVEMKMTKKKENREIPLDLSLKSAVPFLRVSNTKDAVLSWLIGADRSHTYMF